MAENDGQSGAATGRGSPPRPRPAGVAEGARPDQLRQRRERGEATS